MEKNELDDLGYQYVPIMNGNPHMGISRAEMSYNQQKRDVI
jgi:hypothetical protein